MKSLFDPQDYLVLVDRANALSPDAQAQWGKMSVGQMLAHCSKVLEPYAGLAEYAPVPFFMKLMGPLIRSAVFGEKPHRHNSPTAPQFVVKESVDFEVERKRLLHAMAAFNNQDAADAEARKHPLFGRMSADELGWGMYKHLDHHFSQFGV